MNLSAPAHILNTGGSQHKNPLQRGWDPILSWLLVDKMASIYQQIEAAFKNCINDMDFFCTKEK